MNLGDFKKHIEGFPAGTEFKFGISEPSMCCYVSVIFLNFCAWILYFGFILVVLYLKI